MAHQQVSNAYAHYIRLAARKSEFTQAVIDSLNARSLQDSTANWNEDGDLSKVYWRTPDDRSRVNKLKRYADLYKKEHEKHLRPPWIPSGRLRYREINLFAYITTLYADLTMGGGATVRSGNPAYDYYLNEHLKIWHHFYNWMHCVSIYGFMPVQIVVNEKGEVDFLELDPSVIYPEWKEGTLYEFKWISKKIELTPDDLAIPENVPWTFDAAQMDGVVYEERHFEGRIEYYLYATKDDEIVMMMPVQFYDPALPELRPDPEGSGRLLSYVETGIDEFLLILIPNLVFDNDFISDYRDIEGIIGDINARLSQISRILNVHANPKLLLPDSLQQQDPYTGESTARGLRDEILYLTPEDNYFQPQYLTWDAQLTAAYQDIENLINLLCTIAEVSPSLIVTSQSGSSFPESAAAYKMKLTPTINRINRKKAKFIQGLQKFIYVYGRKLMQAGKLKAVSVPPEYLTDIGDGNPNTGDSFFTAADAKVEAEEIDQRLIEIRCKPSLPQDDRFLVERLQGLQSASLKRVLMDVDDMSEGEAVEELNRIQGDNDEMMDGGGVPSPSAHNYPLSGAEDEYNAANQIQGSPAPQSDQVDNMNY